MLNYAIQTAVRAREVKTPIQKRVLRALGELADDHGEVNYSIPDICTRAQACEKTVKEALHELAEREDIRILSTPRVRGHYRINHLPEGDQPKKIDSLRMEIVQQIRLLPLPVRVSVIFQALACYASRNGNNIFPALTTIARDTGYSLKVVRETVRWLLQVEMIAPDADCVNQKYQTRTGYKIPGWHVLTGVLNITQEQIEAIKALHHRRHHAYHESRAAATSGHDVESALEEMWPEEEGQADELTPDDDQPDQLPIDDQDDLAEELTLAETEACPPPTTEAYQSRDLPVDYREVAKRIDPAAEIVRIRLRKSLRPARPRQVTVTLAQYSQAREQVERQQEILAHSDDPAKRRKAEAMIAFYRRTVDLYEQQVQARRE